MKEWPSIMRMRWGAEQEVSIYSKNSDAQAPVQRILDEVIEWDKGYAGEMNEKDLDEESAEEFVEENLNFEEQNVGLWQKIKWKYELWRYGFRTV